MAKVEYAVFKLVSGQKKTKLHELYILGETWPSTEDIIATSIPMANSWRKMEMPLFFYTISWINKLKHNLPFQGPDKNFTIIYLEITLLYQQIKAQPVQIKFLQHFTNTNLERYI